MSAIRRNSIIALLAALAGLLACARLARGATIIIRNEVPAANIATAPGDTLSFDHARIIGTLELKSRQTWTGTVEFVTDNKSFAVVGNGVTDAKIDRLNFKAPCGGFLFKGKASNVRFTGCTFIWGYAGTYYNRIAVRSLDGSDGLVIDSCSFLDSPDSDRNVDIVNAVNHSFSGNYTRNCNDMGHWDGACSHVRIVGNFNVGLSRMAGEFQDNGTNAANHGDDVLVQGNVSVHPRRAYWDSFVGGSWIAQRCTNFRVIDNYAQCDTPPVEGWKQADSSGNFRYGYGYELGFTSGEATGNVIDGNVVGAFVVSMPNTRLKNNRAWGTHAWGSFWGEPGMLGKGSIIDLGGNTVNAGARPPIPTTRPTTQPATNPTTKPAPSASPNNCAASGQPYGLRLTWDNHAADATETRIYIKPKDGGKPWQLVGRVPPGVTEFHAVQFVDVDGATKPLPRNWVFTAQVKSVTPAGDLPSNLATAQVPP